MARDATDPAAVDGVGSAAAAAIREAGYRTAQDVDPRELYAVEGVDLRAALAAAGASRDTGDDRPLAAEFDTLSTALMRATGEAVRERGEGRRKAINELPDIQGVGTTLGTRLTEEHFHIRDRIETPGDVALASVSELTAVDGIGGALAGRMKSEVGSPPWVDTQDDLERVPGVDSEDVEKLQNAGMSRTTLEVIDPGRPISVVGAETARRVCEAVRDTRTVDLQAIANAGGVPGAVEAVEEPRAVPYEAVFGAPAQRAHGETFDQCNKALTAETLLALHDAGVETVEGLVELGPEGFETAVGDIGSAHLPAGLTHADVVAEAVGAASLRRREATQCNAERLVQAIEAQGQPGGGPPGRESDGPEQEQ